MARTLGIDLGTRRMGVAVTDGLGLTAQPVATILRHGGQRDLDAVAALVRQYEVDLIVVGLPVDPDAGAGARGPRRMEQLVRGFAEKLQTALSVPVELVDESFSTVEAEDVLLEADVSRARRKQVIDRMAAAVILQRWLDARRAP